MQIPPGLEGLKLFFHAAPHPSPCPGNYKSTGDCGGVLSGDPDKEDMLSLSPSEINDGVSPGAERERERDDRGRQTEKVRHRTRLFHIKS